MVCASEAFERSGVTGCSPLGLHLVQNEGDSNLNIRCVLAVLPVFAVIGCGSLPPPPPAAVQISYLSPVDQDALTTAYQLIEFDLLECQEVKDNSDDKAVLAIAAKLCEDARGYEPGLESLAHAHEVALPTGLPKDLLVRFSSLHYCTDPNADILYLKDQIDSHENALAVFEEEVSRGENPELIGDSRAVIPVVQRNLAALQRTLQTSSRTSALTSSRN